MDCSSHACDFVLWLCYLPSVIFRKLLDIAEQSDGKCRNDLRVGYRRAKCAIPKSAGVLPPFPICSPKHLNESNGWRRLIGLPQLKHSPKLDKHESTSLLATPRESTLLAVLYRDATHPSPCYHPHTPHSLGHHSLPTSCPVATVPGTQSNRSYPQRYSLLSHALNLFVRVAANNSDVEIDREEPFY